MSRRERTLTPAETVRKERFEALCREMESAGYRKTDLTVGIVSVNIAAVLLMLPFAAALWICYFLRGASGAGSRVTGGPLVFLALLILLMVLHECIHGLVWGLFAEHHLRAVSFGVIWKYLTPYCACAEPLKRWQYILGAAMPTLILGFGLGAVSAALGQPLLLLLAIVMLFSGGGDFLIILKILLRRSGGRQILCCDHPYDCGAVVFEKSDQMISDNCR